ncbi:MAG: protein kinase, partial [Gemmatimonadetes bacterium]|nr:protein kinase [Gemmatimonadota bacterium]
MFALNLLGGTALHGRNGLVTGKAAHKRRLALLAILALARGRTVGRERIVGLLWPEREGDTARHLLSESLYVLRKELGENAFVSAGDEVGLNGEVVRADVEEFERMVQEGDLEGAAEVYRGPFLDGFFVGDAPEFEAWAESERERLKRAHTRVVECLALAREGDGRPAEAADWWRRLAVADPYNSRVGMRLMAALDAAGERASAIWFAETHVALLRDELGVEPQPEFAAMVERLRSEPVRVPPAPPPRPASDAPPQEPQPSADHEAVRAPSAGAVDVERPADPPPTPGPASEADRPEAPIATAAEDDTASRADDGALSVLPVPSSTSEDRPAGPVGRRLRGPRGAWLAGAAAAVAV